MRLLSRADTATQVNATDTAAEDGRAQPVDPGLINQAEAEALAAEELAAAARARADELRARAAESDPADAETGTPQESSTGRWRRLRRPKLKTVLATVAVLATGSDLTGSAKIK